MQKYREEIVALRKLLADNLPEFPLDEKLDEALSDETIIESVRAEFARLYEQIEAEIEEEDQFRQLIAMLPKSGKAN
jgi:hypothetical protein